MSDYILLASEYEALMNRFRDMATQRNEARDERDALAAKLTQAEADVERWRERCLRLEDSPEQQARKQLVLDVIRAKRDAGFDRECAFFKDVWPVALAALKREREST